MIYLDNNATTQPLPEVVEAMLPFLRESYANPSSIHPFGQAARFSVECAREQVARLIAARTDEIVFTSGGTESINLAIRGVLAHRPERRRLVTTKVEHTATLKVMSLLETEGYAVEYVGVDRHGRLNIEEWAACISEETAIASFLYANNETGVIFDVPRLATIAAERGALVHVDAVQSAGKLPIDVRSWPVDLLTLSAHKFHGPKGVGALYVRNGVPLDPLLVGGGQEREQRGGTENVAGIVGMGAAAELAATDLGEASRRIGGLRDVFEAGLDDLVADFQVNGVEADRLCNTANVSFPGHEAQAILMLLGEAGICASSGAACSSGSVTPSHVLQAMGLEDELVRSAIRFSFSRLNTMNEVKEAVAIIPKLLSRAAAVGRR